MAAKKYAFQLKTKDGTYHVDAETGDFLENLDGYEVLSFGASSPTELPDLEDIQEDTSPAAYGPVPITDRFGPAPESEASGSGNVMSRRTAPNDTLRPMGPRKDVVPSKDLPSKLAGIPGSMAMTGVGAAVGSVAGPIGTMVGGLLGSLAGRKMGSFVVDDMRQNPQTMAQPGKTTKSAPAKSTVRSNPLLDNKVERVASPPARSAVTPVTRENISTPAPSYNPNASRPDQIGFESVDSAAFGTPTTVNMPSRPVSPTPLGNARAAPVPEVQRTSLSDIARPRTATDLPSRPFSPTPMGPIGAAPVGQVQRSPLAPVATRSNPLLDSVVERTVGTPAPEVPTPESKPARQVMPSLDYDRFNKQAPQVNWGDYDPAEIDPYTREKVEAAQKELGFSINISSGFRSKSRNAAVDGAKNSQHTHGRAVDISLAGLDDDQRSSLVSALGKVSDPGKGRVGAYSGNTGLHYDTADHGTKNYGGLHPMFDKTIRNMDRAPGWFNKGLQAVEKQDYSLLESQKPRGFNFSDVPQITTPAARPADEYTPGYNPAAGTNMPGTYTSSGLYSRTPEEKQMMGFTIAGELGPSTLKGLKENDPVARAELANVVATMENRAHSTRYEGDIGGVLSPSQYNSLTKGALNTTRNNWGAYGQDITTAIDDYYSGKNKPSTPAATHYANYDIVTPSWDKAAVDKQKVGAHTFSTVNIPGTQKVEYTPSFGFKTMADKVAEKAIQDATKKTFDEGITALDPFTRRDEIEDKPKSTTFTSALTTGYSGYRGLLQEQARTGGFMGEATRGGSYGTPSDYAGGIASTGDGGVSYSRADGSTRNADGTAYDPWSGMRGRTGSKSGGEGGFGSGSMSDSARDSAKSGGGLF